MLLRCLGCHRHRFRAPYGGEDCDVARPCVGNHS
ncbi:hypothetical protein V6Z12_A12G173200 [Gossypium hirsutum]